MNQSPALTGLFYSPCRDRTGCPCVELTGILHGGGMNLLEDYSDCGTRDD